jgi:hypothetical protein
MAQVAEPGLRSARLIAIVLSAGVVMFWIIAWVVLTEGGRGGMAPGAISRELALWIWGATALAGLAAAMLFRGRALDVAGTASRAEPAPLSAEEAGAVQTNLIIAWALLEGPALLSAVFFSMLADAQILWLGAAVFAGGMALTFPRAKWFPAHEVSRAGS